MRRKIKKPDGLHGSVFMKHAMPFYGYLPMAQALKLSIPAEKSSFAGTHRNNSAMLVVICGNYAAQEGAERLISVATGTPNPLRMHT